mmetsp:Transcript_29367/g.37879  ORF Transcript_29367/g.37879 Transcript_29367/m.37879 type:complete len:626 (+) Transcript_29367:130-2007(+)
MPRAQKRRVERYDGQLIFINGEPNYDLGNYLGGGAAGVVYEASNLKPLSDTTKSVAIKILNPVGYKLMSSGPLQRCILVRKGQPIIPNDPSFRLTPENVWWCIHPTTRVMIPAIHDTRSGLLRELPLPKCIEVWGWDPLNEGTKSGSDDELSSLGATGGGCCNHENRNDSHYHHHHHHRYSSSHHSNSHSHSQHGFSEILSDEAIEKLVKSSGEVVVVDGFNEPIDIPKIPIKFIRWLRARQNIYKEIAHMAHLGDHPNVVGLKEVLEYIQDSKTTLFLVLEMVTGGELFDRIKIGKGTSEVIARQYFRQLVDGVGYCHAKGVCHRDLKPENLLLADNSDKAVLKIADFGLSAAFAIAAHSNPSAEEKSALLGAPSSPVNIRRLKSVVGSPHYVAPEVTNEPPTGYDGPKADCWSAGVILFAILAGNLPFAKDLASCERYSKFKKWVFGHDITCRNSMIHILPLLQEDDDEWESDGYGSSPATSHLNHQNKLVTENVCTSPLEGLNWFFPKHFPQSAKGLLVALLHPEPCRRPSMDEICQHEWILNQNHHNNNIERSHHHSLNGAAETTSHHHSEAEDNDDSDINQFVNQVSQVSLNDADAAVARALQQSFDDLIGQRSPPPPPL